MRALAVATMLAAAVLCGCSKDGGSSATSTSAPTTSVAKLTLTSTAFADQGAIPRQFSCDGANQSPALAWSGVPPQTKELVLTVEDPDTPSGTFVHWLLYGIDPGVASLGAGPVGEGTNGTNSAGKRGYAGPCPPKGTQHSYVFTVSALKLSTSLAEGASAAQLRQAIDGSLIAQGRLTGLYAR